MYILLLVHHCLTNPCQNGMACVVMLQKTKCNCSLGFLGDYCESKFKNFKLENPFIWRTMANNDEYIDQYSDE